MNKIKQNIHTINVAVDCLQKGGLIFLATETVYIASVDATNPEAVKKLVSFKNRPFGKPFSVAVTDINMASKYVHINKMARNLYEKFLPGPITVISKGKHNLAPGIEAENGTLGIRIPDYKFTLDIVKKLGKPITATSANASYQKRPYKLTDILENISKKQRVLIDLMVDAGELQHNEPSTVIDTTMEDEPVILRQGTVKLKDKNEVLSRSEENTQNIAKELWQKYESYFGKRAIIFALEGQMGSGKTQFVKGLAKAMQIKDLVTSPSYDLINDYGNLKHLDTWRMQDPDSETIKLGFKTLINDKTVLAIEWADKITKLLKESMDDVLIIWIKIGYGEEQNERLISWGLY